MPITLLDGILVGFTLVSAMLAMVRGLSREILSIASWAAAAVAAYLLYPLVLPYVQPYIDNKQIAIVAAAGVVFIIALIIVTIITMKIADWIIEVVDGLATNGEDGNAAVEEKVRAEVAALCARFPVYPNL